MIYRIYIPKNYKLPSTGVDYETNFPHVVSEIKRLSDGFTVYDARGYWKGLLEDVWVFEIVKNNERSSFEQSVVLTLTYLKSCLNQQAMFYTRDNEGVLI
jgi:hypothetical protein